MSSRPPYERAPTQAHSRLSGRPPASAVAASRTMRPAGRGRPLGPVGVGCAGPQPRGPRTRPPSRQGPRLAPDPWEPQGVQLAVRAANSTRAACSMAATGACPPVQWVKASAAWKMSIERPPWASTPRSRSATTQGVARGW